MKKGTIIFVTLISIIGLTAFGFSQMQEETKTCKVKRTKLPAQAVNLSGDMLAFNPSIIQNDKLFYMVRGKSHRPITKDKLALATAVSDLIESYPSSWIDAYNSIEVIGTCKGKEIKAVSPDINLTKEQKSIFDNADSSSDIAINISYQTKSSGSSAVENNEMNVSMTVVPETEATYIGGLESLVRILREKSIDKIDPKKIIPLKPISILFTINEEGQSENIAIKQTSGDHNTDQLLVKLINEMPKWNPAENSKGDLVKQIFEFTIGPDGC